MNDVNRKKLESVGYTPEILACMEGTSATRAVDRMFLDAAKKALANSQLGALEFLAQNPGLSINELAKKLNRGTSAIGLVMAIYEEADRVKVIRETAKDLLIRTFCAVFPDGFFEDNVGASVKLGSWDYHIASYVGDPAIGEFASNIIKHLAIDNPPPKGWKPQPSNDPVIDSLFDQYWPILE